MTKERRWRWRRWQPRIAGAVLVGLLLPPPVAHAWNDHGHMTVAAIAYRLLTPAARARASALVRLNPDYPRWIARVPRARRDEVAFLRASTWADAIKHDPRYLSDGAAAAAATDPHAGYADRLAHRDWHFIDLPYSPDGTPAPRPAIPNAETQIAILRQALASPTAPDALKSYDLVWLLHLVGDVHQPLHCVSRFNRAEPRGDRGGNAVRLCAPPCNEVLHGFWDAVTGTSEDPDDARTQASELAAADPALAALADAPAWIAESVAVARQSVYVLPIGPGDGPFTLDERYQRQARRVALQRLALAGARLAHLIDQELK